MWFLDRLSFWKKSCRSPSLGKLRPYWIFSFLRTSLSSLDAYIFNLSFFRKTLQHPRHWRRRRPQRRGRPLQEMLLLQKYLRATRQRRRRLIGLLCRRSKFLLLGRRRPWFPTLVKRVWHPLLPLNNRTRLWFWTRPKGPKNYLLRRTRLWTARLFLGQ